jgi:membrane-associated phospholipid phosphatase
MRRSMSLKTVVSPVRFRPSPPLPKPLSAVRRVRARSGRLHCEAEAARVTILMRLERAGNVSLAHGGSAQPRPSARGAAVFRLLGNAWSRRREPQLRAQAFLLLVFLGAVAAFGHIVEDYLTGDPLVRWDVEFSRWLHEHSNPTLVSAFKLFTLLGSVPFLALLVLAVAFLLLRRREVKQAALLCLGALGIEILFSILKLVFHRPRPELAYVHLDTYSFPSGHASGSAGIYAILFYLAARRLSMSAKAILAFAYVALVGLIGFSRLYLEVHYLSDVLAGITLGIGWAAGCLVIYERGRGGDLSRYVPRRVATAIERIAR